MFNLKDKVVLVVGGRGYLGREFCRALREQNAYVISADLPFLSKAAKKSPLKSYDDDIEQMDVDVTNKDSIDLLVSKIEKKHSKIDTLIYSVTAKPDDFYLSFTSFFLSVWALKCARVVVFRTPPFTHSKTRTLAQVLACLHDLAQTPGVQPKVP